METLNALSVLLQKLSVAVGFLGVALAQTRDIQVVPPPVIVTSSVSSNEIIPKLIQCESGGRSIRTLDVNNQYSYGVLQIQMNTWNEWSYESGITGNPMNPNDALAMGHWAISNGHLDAWYNCSKKLGYIKV